MKQMRNLLVVASAMAMMASCSQNDGMEQLQPTEIQATSQIEGVGTKAVVGPNSGVSNVTFLRVDVDAPVTPPTDFGTQVNAIKGSSRSTDGSIVWGSPQNYDGTKNTYMRGYTAPASDAATTKAEWTVDGATDILVTDVWDAGTKATPKKNGMVFKHQLSQIRVICQAAKTETLADLQALWGNITSIQLVENVAKLTYTFSTGVIAPTGSGTDFPLLQGTEFDVTKPFVSAPLVANGAATVCASAMVCPRTATVKLLINTEKKGEKTVTTTLNMLERAKTHTITLSFSANGQDIECTDSTIEDWTEGQPGSATVPGN